MIFGREPAAIAAVIAIGINLAITFGLKLTSDQVGLINSFAIAILALIVRQAVTPVNAPQLPTGTRVDTGDGGTGVVKAQ